MLWKSFICSCKSHWNRSGSPSKMKLGLWMEMKCLRANLDLLKPSMFQVKIVKLGSLSTRFASTITVELSGDSSLN